MKEQIAGNPTRLGVIGAGRIIERVHLPLLAEMQNVVVAGIFDPDYERARAITASFNVPVACRTAEELFDLGLDATLVACPNYLHSQMSIAALEANTHVLCEKPMATRASDAEAMIKAAESAGRNLMIAYTNRFRPEVIALLNAVHSNQLGEVKAIRCGWLRNNGIPGAGTWFTNREQAGGGVLTDLGSHLLDLAIWISGRRRLLSTSCVLDRTVAPQMQASWYLPTDSERGADCDVETTASAFAVFEGPIDLFIEVSWACGVPCDQTYLQVIGERGLARIDTLFGFSPNGHRPRHPLQMWADGEQVAQQVVGSSDVMDPYRKQWEFFLGSLNDGQSLRSSLYDGLAMMLLIEKMYRAAEENHR